MQLITEKEILIVVVLIVVHCCAIKSYCFITVL